MPPRPWTWSTTASSSTPVTGTTTASPGFSVALPTADNSGTATHALTESGSALNDGELTLSADGQNLVATGYDAVPGFGGGEKITGALGVPRTVAIVSQTGAVDTATSLTDSQSEGTTTANNFRSATQAVAGGNIYDGGDGGLGITTDGSSSATYLNTTDSVHEVQVLNGNIYDSTSSNINEVPATGGLPTSGSPADSPLLSGANLPKHFDPDQFAFVNLGEVGPAPDIGFYVADGAGGYHAVQQRPLQQPGREVLPRVGRLDRHRQHHRAPGGGPGGRRQRGRRRPEGGEHLRDRRNVDVGRQQHRALRVHRYLRV